MEILKDLRLQNGLTQKDMAKKLQMCQQTYSRYERQECEPDLKTLCKIADILEVSVDYLLGRETPPNKQNTALSTKDGITDVALNYIKEYGELIGEKRFRDFTKLYRAMNDFQKVYMLAYIIGYLNKSGVNTIPLIGY